MELDNDSAQRNFDCHLHKNITILTYAILLTTPEEIINVSKSLFINFNCIFPEVAATSTIVCVKFKLDQIRSICLVSDYINALFPLII